MRWKQERKVLWTVIGILLVINIGLVGWLAFNELYNTDLDSCSGAVICESQADLIQNVAAEATPSVAFIVTESSSGSGVVISEDGLLVTNYHVIEGRQNLTVRLPNNEIYHAEIVGTDPATDLAVLRISAVGLDPLAFGDSDAVRVGDTVIAIGNPFGYDFTVTSGIISAKNRERGPTEYRDFLQTDASINPGNSGGPLLNTDGEVIGITTFIVSRERMGELGFAIPSNLVEEIVQRLVSEGVVERGYLGVSISDAEEIDEAGEGRILEGSRIVGLDPDGPALDAGLEVGDLLVRVNGVAITDSNQLRNYVAFIPPGTTVNVTVVRENTQLTIPVELVKRPTSFEE